MKCDTCLNSRTVVSENGYHPICCLSARKANACILTGKHYIRHPAKKDKEEQT